MQTWSVAKIQLLFALLVPGCDAEPEPPTDGGGGFGGADVASGGTTPTGGSSTGGKAATGGTGGANTGGRNTGGMATGGSGGTTKCSTAADCLLLTDCCNCVIVPRGTPPPVTCTGECFVDMCTSYGIKLTQADVGCWAGFCVPLADPGNCNAAEVTCNGLPPTCPAGYDYPSVINGCWGPCVVNGSCVSSG
jgi:hypothetical protein